MNISFKGKTVIVTGASSGVGKSAAILFSKAGADVIGIARRAEKLDEVAAIVKKHDGKIPDNGTFTAFVGDITNPDDVQKLFDTVLEKFGKVDVLVNNAGIMDDFTPIGSLEDELWYDVMKLNLTAPMQTMKKAVEIMKEQPEGGNIVNVDSLGGLFGGVAGAAYTASKHGLLGLTKNTAAMYRGNKIRCNAICPGGIMTEIGDHMGEQAFENKKVLDPGFGRMGGISQPEEIANVILFLASDLASSVNGVTLPVDLGFSAF